MDYYENKELLGPKSKNNQPNIDALFLAVYKRKWIIIYSFIVIFLVGFIYLFISKPTYESTVVLKKQESTKDPYTVDPYKQLVTLQSQDDIQTDIALVKTRSVIDKVVDKLNLNISIDKLVYSDGNTININKLLLEYNSWLQAGKYNSDNFPQILSTQIDSLNNIVNMVLVNNGDGRYNLYKIEDNKNIPIGSFPKANPFDISTNNFKITFYWPNFLSGEKLFFTLYDKGDAFKTLDKNVTVEQQGTTNLIGISVKDRYPEIAQLIANTIVNKFLDTRTEQQRQNIQWSYAFIDSQLKDVKKKLQAAEDNLSNYQAASGITKIDANADNLITFLSNLESEKISNDLQLSEYEKKRQEMLNEYKAKGYFDQTYLAPSPTEPASSPFASLLTTLSNLEVKRIELLQKETESHPDVVNLDNQIAQIKKQLSSFNQNTLTAYQIIISTLKEKKTKLENLISQYKSKIQGMPVKETQLSSLTRDKDVYEKVFNLLLDKREEMRIKEVSQLQDISVADPANLPTEPVSPKKLLILVICFFLWGGSSIAFVFIGEFRERRLIKLNEIEDNLQIPIFSIIPEFPKKLKRKIKKAKQVEDRLVSLSQDQPGIVESYNVLRSKLIFSLKNETKLIMFTSCEENSGKTTTVANLGLSLAASDKKVLIIDADLKRCGLTDLIGISRELPGLTTILSEDLRKLPIVDISKGYTNLSKAGSLSILPSGDISEHSSDLFQSAKATVLINALKSSFYDYILIDTPPVTRVIDALILGRIIGNSVMIVRDKHTLRESLDWGIKELRNENVNVFGVVVNACEIEKTSYKHRYGYGYGYKYAYKDNGKGKVKKEKSRVY